MNDDAKKEDILLLGDFYSHIRNDGENIESFEEYRVTMNVY